MKQNATATIGAAEAAKILNIKLTTFYGMVQRGEVPGLHRADVDGDGARQYVFERSKIVEFAKTRTPRPVAKDGSTRGHPRTNPVEDQVRYFGRVTPTEEQRWKKLAEKKGGKLWPIIREMVNKACDRAGV